MLTLVAAAAIPMPQLSAEYALRPVTAEDIPAVARLYFVAYDTGDAAASSEEARDDIEASFAGDYGPLWPEASAVILTGSRIVAAVLTVREAPWPDAPRGPFIIEVFTDRTHRRRGLATALIAHATGLALATGQPWIGLRVSEENAGARRLYASLGFRPLAALGAGAAQPTPSPPLSPPTTGSNDR